VPTRGTDYSGRMLSGSQLPLATAPSLILRLRPGYSGLLPVNLPDDPKGIVVLWVPLTVSKYCRLDLGVGEGPQVSVVQAGIET